MTDIVKFLPTALVIAAVIWFISFQMNPYNVCEDHPSDTGMYICQPFGFEMNKGWLERNPDNKLFGEQRRTPYNKKNKQIERKKIQSMCSNKEYRETEEGLLNCGE